VQLDWRVDVADIKQAVVEVTSSLTKSQHVIRSPPSAPLLGVAWSMTLAVIFKEDRGGCMIALFVNARELPANTTLKAAYKVECVGHRAAYKRGQHVVSTWKTTVGTGDFFRCGPMCDGFDAQAWAAQGLPLDGQVELRLTVC
jgi:hypothetical protein